MIYCWEHRMSINEDEQLLVVGKIFGNGSRHLKKILYSYPFFRRYYIIRPTLFLSNIKSNNRVNPIQISPIVTGTKT